MQFIIYIYILPHCDSWKFVKYIRTLKGYSQSTISWLKPCWLNGSALNRKRHARATRTLGHRVLYPSVRLSRKAAVSRARAENSFLIASVAANSSWSVRGSRAGLRQWAISNAHTTLDRISPRLPRANETIPNGRRFPPYNRRCTVSSIALPSWNSRHVPTQRCTSSSSVRGAIRMFLNALCFSQRFHLLLRTSSRGVHAISIAPGKVRCWIDE